MLHVVHLHLARVTKGALRYEGEGNEDPESDNRLVGVLYLRKSGMQKYLLEDGEDWPKTIEVEVTVPVRTSQVTK